MTPLVSIDPTLGRDEINKMRHEALTLRSVATSAPLKAWLTQFIDECTAKLPSHNCWIEDDKYIVLESVDDGWKHILIHVEFEFEDSNQVAYACLKNYEEKDKDEPPSYNQAPPGLYKRYPYLYKRKVSHETWLDLTKLWIKLYRIKREKAEAET